MKNADQIKEVVKQKYSLIARQKKEYNAASCCGATSVCDDNIYNIMADDYKTLEGYISDADLGLGCGLPTKFAKIKKGDVVIDLGSGAGNDAFVARHEAGAEGEIIGIDFSPVMIAKARKNAYNLGFHNVEFREGEIEKMPVTSSIANVVISNCVLNLVPDKKKVFKEILRVLKPGGHFCISDIVLEGQLPDKLKNAAEMYAGCVAGAIQKKAYLKLIKETGFTDISILKEKTIHIPDEILNNYVSMQEIKEFRDSGIGIYSITVFAKIDECCKSGSGCC